MQFVDHEGHDALALFGHHADAVALPEATDEIFFAPRKLEPFGFDVEHLGHVATNHPADLNTRTLSLFGSHPHLHASAAALMTSEPTLSWLRSEQTAPSVVALWNIFITFSQVCQSRRRLPV